MVHVTSRPASSSIPDIAMGRDDLFSQQIEDDVDPSMSVDADESDARLLEIYNLLSRYSTLTSELREKEEDLRQTEEDIREKAKHMLAIEGMIVYAEAANIPLYKVLDGVKRLLALRKVSVPANDDRLDVELASDDGYDADRGEDDGMEMSPKGKGKEVVRREWPY